MWHTTNTEIWHQLLSLESQDITTSWYKRIHDRDLSARRAKEINSAAKQAREYFRNAANSDYSVRPLLTFYGVASLSRSLILLLRPSGGEECLSGSHGLETVDWASLLSGQVSDSLQNLGDLNIRKTNGLFSHLIEQTKNRTVIHIGSAGADWNIKYDVPENGLQLTLNDLFSRIPDLHADYKNISESVNYSQVNEMKYTQESGFEAKIHTKQSSVAKVFYESNGYNSTTQNDICTLTADHDTFSENVPLFIHSYVHKLFDAIPRLNISVPFENNRFLSQLSITYMVSYILGMLVRYYPTHWISLTQGVKGDTWWPSINRAQQLIEITFPELVIELINFELDSTKSN